ncbi:MAG: hypothetical protein M0R75_14815 [Dehalococcoidia bacterium]|nr:hypothetical protein [Dehalococcoidia bacterium]
MTRITVLVLALGAAVAAFAALGWWWVLTAPARRVQRWVATGTQVGNTAEHAWAVPTEGR